MPRRRVLVADDNPLMREMLCKLFAGHESPEICEEAVNGQDAVIKAIQCKPDLVILDLSMPVMNGLEAAKLICAKFPTVPIILFTQHADLLLQPDSVILPGITRVVPKTEMNALPAHAVDILRVA
jgi:chemotaxis response regulator CheB